MLVNGSECGRCGKYTIKKELSVGVALEDINEDEYGKVQVFIQGALCPLCAKEARKEMGLCQV